MSAISASLLLPIVLYAIATSITPGPNNLMLLSSGLRFGVRRSLAHMLGISLGFAFMLGVTGWGLAQALGRHPLLQDTLKWLGLTYLLWLAWQMTRSSAPDPAADSRQTASVSGGNDTGQPLGFWGAAAFQWINPKAWAMALGLFSAYLPGDNSAATVVLVAALVAVVNFPCISLWAVAGQRLRRWLQNPAALRLFNWSMAALLLASMLPVLWQGR